MNPNIFENRILIVSGYTLLIFSRLEFEEGDEER